MEFIQVEHLTKLYGTKDNRVYALNDISFQVERGEFVSIVGPSGSGKSTLLHILGGVDRPTSGRVLIEGRDIFSFSDEQLAVYRRRQVGLVYQFYNLIPVLNTEENILLPVLMDGRRPDRRRLTYLLEILGMKEKRSCLPNQLSGGQQQRVSIGRALMNSPAVLLADEPTGNLDTKHTQEIMELLKRANQEENQTIILITHDENIALQANRILAIEDGRLVRDEAVRL